MEITVMGIKTRYEQFGEGSDVVLLHGWMCCVETFTPVTRFLSKSHRVTVIDFPGFGQSGQTPEPWDVTKYAEYTEALLDALSIPVCDILGHSFGGRVALLLSSTRPERVRKLVLTGCAGLIPKRGLGYRVKKTVFGFLKRCFESRPVQAILGKRAENFRSGLRSAFGSSDYKQLSGVLRETFVLVVNQDLRPCLPNIKASTLLIWGENDTETPLWMGKVMEKEIKDAGLVVYPGAGHYAYLDRTNEFCAVAGHFLKGIAR